PGATPPAGRSRPGAATSSRAATSAARGPPAPPRRTRGRAPPPPPHTDLASQVDCPSGALPQLTLRAWLTLGRVNAFRRRRGPLRQHPVHQVRHRLPVHVGRRRARPLGPVLPEDLEHHVAREPLLPRDAA